MGTATINAKGAYAFLEGNGQSAQTIDFAVNNGRGGFLVVLDTSKGIIPKGFDAATITATVNGVNGQTTIAMSCQYPPPTVLITNPSTDTTIHLSAANQPTIVLAEEHSPAEGQFVPSILWDPSVIIATSEYFDQIEDTLVLIVKVTAENDGGTAFDSTRILLVKTSGVPIIDSVRTSTGETVFPVGTTVTLEGYYHDPDFDHEFAGWGMGPPPSVITSTGSGTKPVTVALSAQSSSPSTSSLLATGEGTIQNLGENTFTFFVRDAAGNEASRNLTVYGVAPCPNQGVVYLVNKQHQDANQFCVRGTDFIAVGAAGFAVNLPYDFAGVETCFDESRRCWTQRLNYIAKNIVYGVCTMYLAGLVDVSEVPLGITKEQACRIVADLRRIISNEKAWISKNQYYSYQAVLKHEEVHADLLEAMLKSFGDAAESELRLKCLNEGKARTLQEAVRLLGTPRIVNAKLSEQFDKFRELKKHSSEARAALEGNKFRRQLINGIEVRYGKCSAGTF